MLIHSFRHSLMLSVVGLSALLLGCVTVPDVIKGTTATPLQDLDMVRSAPQIYAGQEARFGGVVVSVTNQPQHTRLEIASMPLDAGARPILGEPSQGRLIAYVNKFLEPIDFKGHLITVVGSIAGVEAGKIGMTTYDFVVINVTGYKRWNLEQQVIMPPAPMGPWGSGLSVWAPGWGWYDAGPVKVQTIVTE